MTFQLVGAVLILIVLALGARTVERWAGRLDGPGDVRRPPTRPGEVSDRFATQPLRIPRRR
jgi:hypothetical protein